MKQIEWINTNTIYGAVTLKDNEAPEANNMALHVCQNPENVMINRNNLSEFLQLPLENWVLPWQKHTDQFTCARLENRGQGAFDKNTSIMDVDAIYTTEHNLLIGVFTADCVGMLVIDETTPFIGAIHSGWKGTTQAITTKCIQAWIQQGLIHPEHTTVFFSPSILFDSLEVGLEVVEQIQKLPFDTSPYIRYTSNKKAYIDNQGLNFKMLTNEGILPEHCHLSSLDTKKEIQDCFSYRNDKKTGEHFTYGFIKKS